MNQVIVFPRGQLAASDKSKMTKVGIVAIEADDPRLVVAVVPGASIVSADDLAMSALKAVSEAGYGSVKDEFVKELYRRALERNKQK